DTVSSEATMTKFNLAYDLSLDWGPVSGVQFYIDYGIIYDKSDDSADTSMNVTGMSVSAGPLFTYFEFIQARNQPFIGGTI
ncbi:carbohydrate porin, partial [Pseudoalteromonas carrageenovora]